MYPPQAVRQVIFAVDCLVAGGDVAEVAGLLHAVWWREGFEGEEAVVAVHLIWNTCQTQRQLKTKCRHVCTHKLRIEKRIQTNEQYDKPLTRFLL